MTTKLRLLTAIIAAPLLAAPTCGQSGGATGDPEVCQAAVDHLESECGIPSDGPIDRCTAWDECVAECVLDASCEAFSEADSAAVQSFEACSNQCNDDGSGGSGANAPGCQSCADFLDGAASYDEVCESGQQLLDEWSACICQGPCEVPCYSYCQGIDPDPMCSDCVATSCAAETEACQVDD